MKHILLRCLTGEFFRKLLVQLPLNFGGFALQFLIALILARLLGPAEYGIYVYHFSCASILTIILSLGFDQFAVKEFPKLIENNQKNRIPSILNKTLGGVCILAFVSVFVFLFLQEMQIIPDDINVQFVVGISVIMAATNISVGILQSQSMIVFPQAASRLGVPILFFCLLVVLIFSAGIHVSSVALLLYLVAGTIVLLIMLTKVYRVLNQVISWRDRVEYSTSKLLITSSSLAFVSLTFLLNSNIDILMIGAFLEHEDVAVYRIANRGAIIIGLVLVVINQIVMPMLSQYIASSNYLEAQKLISKATLSLICIGVPAAVILFLGADIFASIFGEEYLSSADPLRILIFATLIDILTGTVASILILSSNEKIIVVMNVVGICVNIIANYFLLESYGVVGAAIATVAAVSICKLGLLCAVIYKTKYVLFRFSDLSP